MASKRYDKINALIRKWEKEGQDINILRGIYGSCNLEESDLVDRSEDLKHGTNYTNFSQEEFVNLFKADKFSALNKTQLKHLFQELHNRYIKDKGYDVTRNVAVVDDKTVSAYGYVCSGNDLMFINKASIDKAKMVEPEKNNFNKTNIGYSLLYVISHESQHVAQFENSIDYMIGDKKLDSEMAFLAAMTTIENANMAVDDATNNPEFLFNWKSHYDYQFIEHNANYSAFKKAKEMIPDSEKKGKAYNQYDAFTTLLALRDTPSLTRDSKEFIADRVAKMEEFAKYEIEFFEKNTADCPIKQKLLETAHSFIKVDENGNSPFRNKLNREIGEMVDVCKNARMELFKDKKNNKKNTSNKKASDDEFLPQL